MSLPGNNTKQKRVPLSKDADDGDNESDISLGLDETEEAKPEMKRQPSN